MSFLTAESTLTKMFADGWTAAGETAPVNWPNTGDVSDDTFTPPDADPSDPEGSAWVRFSIDFEDAEQASMASANVPARFRSYGTIIVEVFVPKGANVGEALRLIDQAAAIFRRKSVPGFRFLAPSQRRVGGTGDVDGRWHKRNLYIPVERDDFF